MRKPVIIIYLSVDQKKEIEWTGAHKSTSDLQRLEREKRLKRREEIREQVIALQRGMTTGVTDQERNPPDSSHDRHEEGVDEETTTHGRRLVDIVARSPPTRNSPGGKTSVSNESEYPNSGHYRRRHATKSW